MIEVLKVLGLFMLAVPLSIALGILIIGIPCVIWIAIDKGIDYIRENINND